MCRVAGVAGGLADALGHAEEISRREGLRFLHEVRGRDDRRLEKAGALRARLHGTLETGRSLDYLYAGDENRKLCSLYLSIMDRMGVKLDKFGDAETRLAGF